MYDFNRIVLHHFSTRISYCCSYYYDIWKRTLNYFQTLGWWSFQSECSTCWILVIFSWLLSHFPRSERTVVLYCCAFCLNNVLFSASLETTKEGRWWRFVVCQTIHPSICFMADSVAQVSGMGRRRRIGLCFVGFLFSDAYNISPVENEKQKLEFVIQRCLLRLDCASENE